MEDDRQAKKTKVLMKMTKKMDTMKHEMYNTHQYRHKFRTLIDFEKKTKMNHYKHFVQPKERNKSTLETRNKLRTLYQYLWDVKIIPLYKILRDSRKIIFYSEWLYFYKEIEISPIVNEILRDSKKKNLIASAVDDKESIRVSEEELKNTICRMTTLTHSQILKLKELTNSLKKYFNRVSQILPDNFKLALKNTPCVLNFPKRTTIVEEKTVSPPLTTVEKYKMFLNTFKQCVSSKSPNYKFIKSPNGTSLHPSFTNCLKKLSSAQHESKTVTELFVKGIAEEEEIEEIAFSTDQPFLNLDSIYDSLIPLKYKIDFINLYLGDIEPDTVCLLPTDTFYPFDNSKIMQDETIGEDSTINVIENNLYGVKKEDM